VIAELLQRVRGSSEQPARNPPISGEPYFSLSPRASCSSAPSGSLIVNVNLRASSARIAWLVADGSTRVPLPLSENCGAGQRSGTPPRHRERHA
jgi:hypothetical protein